MKLHGHAGHSVKGRKWLARYRAEGPDGLLDRSFRSFNEARGLGADLSYRQVSPQTPSVSRASGRELPGEGRPDVPGEPRYSLRIRRPPGSVHGHPGQTVLLSAAC